MPRYLRIGSTGPLVSQVQAALNQRLLPSPRLAVTGVYDGHTAAAVRRFQQQVWLEVDGLAGDCTQNALFDREGPAPVLHNVPYLTQPTPTTCWAASAAMLKNTTVMAIQLSTPQNLLNTSGALLNSSEAGANHQAHRAFGRIHGLTFHRPMSWLTSAICALVDAGPVMMQCLWNLGTFAAGSGSSGHWVVLVGVRGNRDEAGRETTFRVYDPLNGIYSANYFAMLRRYPLATFALFTR
mgnify:CR=1 FL=1